MLKVQPFLPGEAVSSSPSCGVGAPCSWQEEHRWSLPKSAAEPWVRLWPWRPGDASGPAEYAEVEALAACTIHVK